MDTFFYYSILLKHCAFLSVQAGTCQTMSQRIEFTCELSLPSHIQSPTELSIITRHYCELVNLLLVLFPNLNT